MRTLFLVVLGFWLVVPFAYLHSFGQDGLPFVVVSQLAHDHPSDVYTTNGDLFSPTPTFLDTTCALAPAGTDCAAFTVAFVSPPISLTLTAPLKRLGGDGGVFALRLGAALSLASGMLIIWRRLISDRPGLAPYLVVIAVLLTPFVMVPLSLAQNSPLMFLSACLGTHDGSRTRRAIAIAAILSLTVAFKFSPLVLVGVLAWQRRWKVVASVAVILTVVTALTVAIYPRTLFGDFLTATRSLTTTAIGNPYNGAVDSNLHDLWAPLVSSGPGSLASTAIRILGAGVLFWWVGRRSDPDTQWAYSWVLLLLFLPLVWWHYLLVSIPAVAYAWRAAARNRRLTDRTFLVVVGVVAATVPISVPNARGASWPMVQVTYLLAIVILVPLFLLWSRPRARSRQVLVARAG
jgi:hypothetical protein